MKNNRQKIAKRRVKTTQSPESSSVIKVSWMKRKEIADCFAHFLKTGRNLNVRSQLVRLVIQAMIALFVSIAVYGITFELFDAYTFSTHFRSACAFIVGVLVYFVLDFIWASGQKLVNNTSPLNNIPQQFDRLNAPHWEKYAASTLIHCGQREIVEPIIAFQDDTDVPYRILKGFAPVPVFALRRPKDYRPSQPSNSRKKWEEDRLFKIDALCGGLLHVVGARPDARFLDGGQDGDKIVQDFYWRYDVQELPDTIQDDICLRFCQSTIERPAQSTCTYKTYVAINNFRKRPILLLRVKDIVNCLENKEGAHDEHNAMIFRSLKHVNEKNVLHILSDHGFERYPPRMERVTADSTEPISGPILFKYGEDDWTMMFDPARVWAQEGNDKRTFMEAIVALRRAIHLVSRQQAIEVTLKKRDVLIVDNLRILVGRWEDRPGFSICDMITSFDRSLEGRWLRLVFGFPLPKGTSTIDSTHAWQNRSVDDPYSVNSISAKNHNQMTRAAMDYSAATGKQPPNF